MYFAASQHVWIQCFCSNPLRCILKCISTCCWRKAWSSVGSGSGSGHCGASTAMKSGLATLAVHNVQEIFFSCNLPSLPGSLRTQALLSFFSFLPNSRSPGQFDLGVDVQRKMVIKMLAQGCEDVQDSPLFSWHRAEQGWRGGWRWRWSLRWSPPLGWTRRRSPRTIWCLLLDFEGGGNIAQSRKPPRGRRGGSSDFLWDPRGRPGHHDYHQSNHHYRHYTWCFSSLVSLTWK